MVIIWLVQRMHYAIRSGSAHLLWKFSGMGDKRKFMFNWYLVYALELIIWWVERLNRTSCTKPRSVRYE